MAMSKPGTQDAGQHYLVCNTEGCQSNCQFYCKACLKVMCELCRDEHLKNPDNKKHKVVPYRQRRLHLPKENCKNHPTRNIDMHCDDCNIPLCSQCCTMEDHLRHKLVDLETIYYENCAECQGKIRQIYQYFIPTSEELRQETKADTTEIKKIMDDIRTSMKAEGKRLKKLVEKVILQKIVGINDVEKSITAMLQNQGKIYEDYISYLKDVVEEFSGYLSSTQLLGNPMISTMSGHLTINSIPQTTKPFPPVFTPGQFSEEDVSKLLGTVNASKYKQDNRAIKPMETLKPTDQMKQDEKKSDVKQTLSLSSFVTKVKEYTGVRNAYHISLGKSGSGWVSDDDGNLVQTDLQGNALQKIKTSSEGTGYHTVTQDMDLMYADRKKHVIKRITMDNKVTEFIKTGDWEPLSIHSSKTNGDILVGMKKDNVARVTRYNKTGREIQGIQRDNKDQKLYSNPHYITENINGDICTSDISADAVVVVNKSGHHRFSYSGQHSRFLPWGICTDVVGHIIVCEGFFGNRAVHILDEDGGFLRFLLKEQDNTFPYSVCIDDGNNLHVGTYLTNKVTVFKYLQ
uniref:E3 ubiquitin-protein ligase TRIM71-like n=1 Tax=Crassostrea virginica TaxID=6565 RepID=A0A8B8CHB8_CRAVI|nr:E3 ubiquitin-protein ligase TRIM71-like [Crassostrea virginica]XP_022315208.1 E3 ubiquitin-protein ligase TRIM71-like [Crassostrea virginica]XP_022315209.1 E3 ubiquitin-protein ligase TRIM71-like [Crassostrea virginica]